MKYLFPYFLVLMILPGKLFSQSAGHLSSTIMSADKGSVFLEHNDVTPSVLSLPQELWVFGDGNFEIKQTEALSTTHQFRILPTEDTYAYGINIYDDGSEPPVRLSKPYYSTAVGTAFTPTGVPVENSGLVAFGHYGALKIFPGNLNFRSTPVAIIALLNHQSSPVSGTAYLYYKTNLKRNGVDDIPVSYSVYKDHYNYGGVALGSLQNVPTRPGYQILRSWNFSDLQPNEERHLFVSLDTTPSWQNISDLNTANYETEFLLFVRGNGVFAFEKEVVVSPTLEISHDPAFLDVSFDSREETTFDLLFYNEGTMPVGDIQVAFEFPAGMKSGDFQILEKAIGPVDFLAEPHSTEGATTLKFEAKNVGLGKYDPNNPNTYGKIKIKAKMAPENWQRVKASVTFDDLPAEAALWRNVPSAQN